MNTHVLLYFSQVVFEELQPVEMVHVCLNKVNVANFHDYGEDLGKSQPPYLLGTIDYHENKCLCDVGA